MEPLQKKLVFVGDEHCGKSSLLAVYAGNPFPDEYSATVFDSLKTHVIIDDERIDLVLWDTAGTSEYDRLRPLSYPNADVVVICFSIDDVQSFKNVADKWSPEVRHHCKPDIPMILVGNKKDTRNDRKRLQELRELNQKPIPTGEGHAMATRIRAYGYLECSAIAHEGILEIIQVAAMAAQNKKHKLLKGKKCMCEIM